MHTETWPLDTVQRLAKAFADDLRANVTPEQFAEIRRRNATPDYDRACASHDFVDANECMESAFVQVIGRDPESDASAEHESDNVLWSRAWDLAKREYLTDAEAR